MGTKVLIGVFICAFALFCANSAYADGASFDDSRLSSGRDGPPPSTPPITLQPFIETANNLGGGTSFFMNDMKNLAVTKVVLTSTTPLGHADHVDCNRAMGFKSLQLAFGACTVSCPHGNCKKGDIVTIVFLDPIQGGILPGQMLFIDLDSVFGTPRDGGGWKGDKTHPGNGVSSFSAQATFTPVSSPEPGSLLLVLAGLGGVSLLRRRS